MLAAGESRGHALARKEVVLRNLHVQAMRHAGRIQRLDKALARAPERRVVRDLKHANAKVAAPPARVRLRGARRLRVRAGVTSAAAEPQRCRAKRDSAEKCHGLAPRPAP